MEESLSHKMRYTPGIFDNICRWHFVLEIDISMIFRWHKHIKRQGTPLWKGKRKCGSFFKTVHNQCKKHVLPIRLELRGIFKRTDDHIFEKTLKIKGEALLTIG